MYQKTMKKIIFLCLFAAFSLTLSAQKIKIKKGTVYVDKKPFLKIDKEFGNRTITTLDGEVLFAIKNYSYDKPNPARNNPSDPNRMKYPATILGYYNVITFLDMDLTYETELPQKKLFKAMYKYKLLDDNGKLNKKNAQKIAVLISKEVSGNIPVVIFTNNN